MKSELIELIRQELTEYGYSLNKSSLTNVIRIVSNDKIICGMDITDKGIKLWDCTVEFITENDCISISYEHFKLETILNFINICKFCISK